MSRFTEHEKADAVAAYLGGSTCREVGEWFSASPGTVLRWVRASGHDTRKRGKRSRYSDADRAHAVADYIGGASLRTTADRAGASVPTVHRWILNAGVKTRRFGRRWGGPYTLQVRLAPQLLEKLDRARGEVGRCAFVRAWLESLGTP